MKRIYIHILILLLFQGFFLSSQDSIRIEFFRTIRENSSEFPHEIHDIVPIGDIDSDGLKDFLSTKVVAIPATNHDLSECFTFSFDTKGLPTKIKQFMSKEEFENNIHHTIDRIDTIGDIDNNGINDLILITSEITSYIDTSFYLEAADHTWTWNNYALRGGIYLITMNQDKSIKKITFFSARDLGHYYNFNMLFGNMVRLTGDLDGNGTNEILINCPFNSVYLSNGLNFDNYRKGGFLTVFLNQDLTIKKTSLVEDYRPYIPFVDSTSLNSISACGHRVFEVVNDLNGNGISEILIDALHLDALIICYQNQKGMLDSISFIKESDNIPVDFNVDMTLIPDINYDGIQDVINFTPSLDSNSNRSFLDLSFYYLEKNGKTKNKINLNSGGLLNFGSCYNVKFVGDINFDGFPEFMVLDNDSNNSNIMSFFSIKPQKCILNECVWPGDVNSDGIVTSKDLFGIGQSFGFSDSTKRRILPSEFWEGQYSDDWTNSFEKTNYKHADCNGDGIIDNNDIRSISINHNKALSKRNTIKVDLNGPKLKITPIKESFQPGDTIIFNISLGDIAKPTDQIYGVSMHLEHNVYELFETKNTAQHNNCWLGNIDSNLLTFSATHPNGISFSMVRNNHTNKSGYGNIGTIKIPFNKTFENPEKHLKLTLADLSIIRYDGEDVFVESIYSEPAILKNNVTTNQTKLNSENILFPNPASDVVHFNQEVKKIDFYDIQGVLCKTEFCLNGSSSISIKDLKKGVYVVKVRLRDSFYISKLFIE